MVHRTGGGILSQDQPYIKEWADRISITLFLEQIAVCLVSQPWRSKLLTNVKLWRAIQNQTKFCAQAAITVKRVKTGAFHDEAATPEGVTFPMSGSRLKHCPAR
jgi:hypothetical protein